MKIFHYKLIIFLMYLVIAVLAVKCFYTYYPFNPLEFKDTAFPVLNEKKTLHVGDKLRYLVRYCKYAAKPAHVSYQLVNSVIYLSSTEKTANVAPGCGEKENEFVIPDIEVGEGDDYTLETIIEYQYPFGRTISVTQGTEKFRLLPREETK